MSIFKGKKGILYHKILWKSDEFSESIGILNSFFSKSKQTIKQFMLMYLAMTIRLYEFPRRFPFSVSALQIVAETREREMRIKIKSF